MRLFSALVRLVLITAIACFVFGVSRSFVSDAQSGPYVATASVTLECPPGGRPRESDRTGPRSAR